MIKTKGIKKKQWRVHKVCEVEGLGEEVINERGDLSVEVLHHRVPLVLPRKLVKPENLKKKKKKKKATSQTLMA